MSKNPQDHLIWWQLFYVEYAKEILEEGIGNTVCWIVTGKQNL